MIFLNCSHLQRSPETIFIGREGKPMSLTQQGGENGKKNQYCFFAKDAGDRRAG